MEIRKTQRTSCTLTGRGLSDCRARHRASGTVHNFQAEHEGIFPPVPGRFGVSEPVLVSGDALGEEKFLTVDSVVCQDADSVPTVDAALAAVGTVDSDDRDCCCDS